MAENRKFWHPVPFGLVLLIFFGTQLVAHLALVGVREGLGIAAPIWIAGGVGGASAVLIVNLLGRRMRATRAPTGE